MNSIWLQKRTLTLRLTSSAFTYMRIKEGIYYAFFCLSVYNQFNALVNFLTFSLDFFHLLIPRQVWRTIKLIDYLAHVPKTKQHKTILDNRYIKLISC